ncbi:MAG: response regulator [Chitinophagaceae bacterium]
MGKITILLVDDHKLISDSCSFILNSDPRFKVIGETSSGQEAISIAVKKKPSVILMDVNMSPESGFDITRDILEVSPDCRIIGVSMHTMPAYARRMLKLGAMGYVTKNSSKEEMMTAIEEINQGKKYICKEVKDILVNQELKEDSEKPGDLNDLSRRELEVINLIKVGLKSKEIGLQLEISTKTVEVHRYNVLRKLKLKNSVSLVNFLNDKGL